MAKTFEERVMGLIKGQRLVRKGDKVLVAVSGGKDSSTVAWILGKYADKLGIKVAILHLDQGITTYSKNTRKKVEELAETLDLPLYIHEWGKEWGMPFPAIVGKLRKAPCYICGILKRYYQNALARALGYNVLATGHNLDDSVGFIINNLITGQIEYIAKLSPILPETELTPRKIKPLFWMQEREIRTFAEENSIPFASCQCPFQKLAPTYIIRRSFDEVERLRPGAKKSLVKNVMKLVPKDTAEQTQPNACKYCGEPTSGEICAVCKMKIRTGIKPGPVQIQKENLIRWS